jgi:hypothetical protein
LDFHQRALPFHCPAAKFPKPNMQNIYAYFSIAMNSQLTEPPHKTVLLTSLERYSSSDLVLFAEGRLPDEPPADVNAFWTELGQPAVHTNRVAMRHNRQTHLGMLDTSVHANDLQTTHGRPNFMAASLVTGGCRAGTGTDDKS